MLPRVKFFLLITLHAICTAEYTNIQDYPGFSQLRTCAQCSLSCDGFSTLFTLMGCSDWNCVCNNFDVAMSSASAFALQECSRTQDVSSATSVLNGFCYQLPSSIVKVITPVTPTAFIPSYTTPTVGGGSDGGHATGMSNMKLSD